MFFTFKFICKLGLVQPHQCPLRQAVRLLLLLISKSGWLNNQSPAKQYRSIGTSQGCVLPPLLYILYTNDCVSNHKNIFFYIC